MAQSDDRRKRPGRLGRRPEARLLLCIVAIFLCVQMRGSSFVSPVGPLNTCQPQFACSTTCNLGHQNSPHVAWHMGSRQVVCFTGACWPRAAINVIGQGIRIGLSVAWVAMSWLPSTIVVAALVLLVTFAIGWRLELVYHPPCRWVGHRRCKQARVRWRWRHHMRILADANTRELMPRFVGFIRWIQWIRGYCSQAL